MAVNPTDQDKRGVVRRNFDDTFDSEYPAGDKPQPSVPDAITDLAIDSIGTNSADLSWTLPANTDNVRVYKRDVTAGGSFNLIETLGAVETYTAPGLDPETEYEWYVVAVNEEGDSGDSNVVSGTTPAEPAADDITDLSVSSISSGAATLQWTANGETLALERRETGGTFAVVQSGIGGSVNQITDTGLSPETEYDWRLTWDSETSNTATDTTSAALGEEYQLATGEFTASRFPLQWTNPDGNETSRSAFLWSHSEFDYVRRVTVSGGSPPYYFYLDSPVTGVSFERQAPTWNPYLFLWGMLTIDHNEFTSGTKDFTLKCVDQEGTTLTLPMTVTVDDSKFVFMEDGTGSSSGTGTLADPYEDLGDIYGTSDTDDTHVDKIIVARSGSYLIDNFDTANPALQWNQNKPIGWIPYPGESISFTNSANINVGHTSSTLVDCYFGKATYNGGDGSSSNARVFANTNDHKRIVWDNPTFIDPVVGTSGTDNTNCIFFAAASGRGAHTEISIIDGLWDGLPPASNGVGMFDLYNADNVAVVGGSLINSSTNRGAWVKRRNNHVMVAGLNCYDASNDGPGQLFNPSNGDSGDPLNVVQFVGCKGYREEDGLQNDAVVYVGDGNESWGHVYMDRMTIVGQNRVLNSDATNSEAFLEGSIVINSQSTKISSGFTQTDNVADSRSDIGDYLDANGDVLTSYSRYGEQGANYVAPEAG